MKRNENIFSKKPAGTCMNTEKISVPISQKVLFEYLESFCFL